jgi:hypothetical protein
LGVPCPRCSMGWRGPEMGMHILPFEDTGLEQNK